MNSVKLKQPVSIYNDPWESYNDVKEHGQLTLSNIEFTTTNLCNMRCSHCAVGYTLQTVDPEPLDMDLMKFQICERCQLQVANQCFLKSLLEMLLNLY